MVVRESYNKITEICIIVLLILLYASHSVSRLKCTLLLQLDYEEHMSSYCGSHRDGSKAAIAQILVI